MRVARGKFVFPHIGGIEDRLRREEVERLEERLFLRRVLDGPREAAVLQHRHHPFHQRLLRLRRGVPGLCGTGRAVEALLERDHVGERELGVDHDAVAHRVGTAHHVLHVVVLEAANHVHDRVDLADVGEELVAEAFALGRALDQAGDVDELHRRGNGALGVDQLGDLADAVIRDLDHAGVRLDGGEGIVGDERARRGQRIEERGFPDVGKADDTEGEHEGPWGGGS